VHPDTKPETFRLQDGRALGADFGTALAASSAGTRMTEPGMSRGTPAYMSPEQAMGERTLDARTDVYALGVVTYEMLVGDPPFLGGTAQAIVAKVMTEKPVPPSRARDTIPEHVDEAVLTALSKLPADRFATAAEFAAALAGGTRMAELERMLGGDPESEVSRAHARELLDTAAALTADAPAAPGAPSARGARRVRK
jgi:serine/threonine-protein kinase